MELVETLKELRALRRKSKGTVGLVATMGALHSGHESLLRAAREDCNTLVASLYVNPTQFGDQADLDRYPRNIQRDLAIMQAEKVDFVWMPSTVEMYPDGEEAEIEIGPIASVLEGAARPGHFNGVATVVSKLFDQVRPHVSYFGQKDWQQTRVIHALINRLSIHVKVKVIKTIREEGGLAWSSRNEFLSRESRIAASILYKALQTAETAFSAGENDGHKLRMLIRQVVGQENLVEIDYASVANARTLEELTVAKTPIAFLGAIRIEGIRLIDNIVFGVDLYPKMETTIKGSPPWSKELGSDISAV